MRQQCVLLGAVEAVDLVEEQDGAATLLTHAGAGALGDLAHVLHPGGDRRQRLEGLAGRPGDQPGDRRLPRARWAPEDHRREAIGLDEHAQRTSRAAHLVLAEDPGERSRPPPCGEWGTAL